MNSNKNNTYHCGTHPIYRHLINDSEDFPESEQVATKNIEQSETAQADYLIVGRIITMDEKLPEAEAMVIKQGKVLALGAESDLQSHVGATTKRIDLDGKTLYPGFIDSHIHIWSTAIIYTWIDCSPLSNPTIEDVKAQITAAVKSSKPGEWILGKLFDPSLYKGFPELTRIDLDALAPDNPVFILNASMHFAYVNSKALQIADISEDVKDLTDGHYGRTPDGKLNGVIGELSAITPILQHIDKIKPAGVLENIQAITSDAARVGVTTVREAGTGGMLGAKEVSILRNLMTAGQLKTRISLALLDDAAQKWPESPDTMPGAGDDYLWIGARKIVADGSNQGRSGYMRENYLGTDQRGQLNISAEDMRARIKWCNEHGWQVMVHANGDEAVAIVVNAYNQALKDSSDKGLRHRIEHCSLVEDGLFEKMAEVGVTPSFLINHLYYWGQTLKENFIGPKRVELLDRTASALKAGLKFTMHSDYNVSPINPLHYVQVAVNRKMQNGEVLNESEKVSVYQAMKAITIDAAWQMHKEDKLGSLAPGKQADFVILDKDPQQVEVDDIDKIKIQQTWLAGIPTFQK